MSLTKVSYPNIQNVSATDKLLGRSTVGAGVLEEIACTAAGRALIDDADATAQRTTLGLGTLATQSGTSSGTNTGDQTIALTGGVTGSGTGSFATTVVTNANLTGPITSIGNTTTIADAELAAIAGLTSAADKGIRFTGSGTAATFDLTPFALSLLDDADATAMRTTLGVVTAHSGLSGLGSDDHTIYLLVSGARAMTAALNMGGFAVSNVSQLNDTNGVKALGILPTSGAVNFVEVLNALTGTFPRVIFNGSDTNVSGVLATKGSGRIFARYSSTNYELACIDLAQPITNKTFAAASGNTIDASLITSGTFAEARLGSGTGTATKVLRGDSTWRPIGLVLHLHCLASSQATWTDMPSAATFLGGSHRHILGVDLTGYTQVRFGVNKAGTAGFAGSKLILRYRTTHSITVGDYSDIGTSEVSAAIDVTDTTARSSWIDIAAGAKEDVFLTVVGSGGNGVVDPQYGAVYAEFR